jgi:hypothetical protein
MFVFSDRVYEILKKLVQIILPAISSAYFGLASIWDLPEPEKVVGTIAILTTFLGVCLGISNKTYSALNVGEVGTLQVTEDQKGKMIFGLEMNGDPLDILDRNEVRFKVNKTTAPSPEFDSKQKPPS